MSDTFQSESELRSLTRKHCPYYFLDRMVKTPTEAAKFPSRYAAEGISKEEYHMYQKNI
jgi:hypothetical protein